MALRSMQGAGSGVATTPPLTDLARENAPTKVLELIGDPRSGVADDVARNPFGGLTVDMLHYQPSNEVYWYKYELYGNQMKEGHRDSRLSEYSKNLMYLLRAKDPSRWTIDALSKKFRVRKQRVLSILALKEMEGHELEQTLDQGGPLSAYACRVRMSDVHLDPATGEPLELGSSEMRRMEIESARAAMTPPIPVDVLKGGQGLTPAAAVAEADPAVLPLHNALPRLAVMAHQVQLELLGALQPVGFDLGRLRTEVQAGLDKAEARLRACLPASCFAAQEAAQQSGEDEDADDGNNEGESRQQQQDPQQQQQAAVAAAVGALHTQKQCALAVLDALEDVLLEPSEGSGSQRAFRSSSLQQEQRVIAAAAALPRAMSTASGPSANPNNSSNSSSSSSHSSSGGSSSSAPSLDEVLSGLKGPQLLRVVKSLPPHVRNDLLSLHPPTKVALNQMGVDLTALTSSKPAQTSAGAAPGALQVPSGSPFPDVLSYTYISPAQYSCLQQALQALSNASEAAAAAIQEATTPPAALTSTPSAPHAAAPGNKEQQQQQRPDEVVAAAARLSASYQAVVGACEHLRVGGQGSESRGRMSAEEITQRLKVLAEVDPQLVEAAYDVEAVQQIRQLGTRSTEQKEAQLWWDALQRYKATHGDTFGSPSTEGGEEGGKTGKRASEVMREGGTGPARHSWEAIAAWLDVFPGGKVYHRGSGERQISRMPSFPAFEGLPLSTIDTLEEGELSAMNRSKAQEHEAQLCQDFEANLLYNLGLRGDGLRDASMPRTPSNLASSLDEAPMVVYDITREGQTVHPPLYVLDKDGRRPLNEQENVFQERRLRDVQADQFPWLRPHYTMRRIRRKPELQ